MKDKKTAHAFATSWNNLPEGSVYTFDQFVDPIRFSASKLPWWFTKFFIATPLVFWYFIYAYIMCFLGMKFMPLNEYGNWITKRGFLFFRHLAFDQLVMPQTTYIPKSMVEEWLKSSDRIDPVSCYILFRKGNSWKFGAKLKA